MTSLPKLKTLETIEDSGLVAVVRAKSSEQASRIADACAAGGVGAIEITFTVSAPLRLRPRKPGSPGVLRTRVGWD